MSSLRQYKDTRFSVGVTYYKNGYKKYYISNGVSKIRGFFSKADAKDFIEEYLLKQYE